MYGAAKYGGFLNTAQINKVLIKTDNIPIQDNGLAAQRSWHITCTCTSSLKINKQNDVQINVEIGSPVEFVEGFGVLFRNVIAIRALLPAQSVYPC